MFQSVRFIPSKSLLKQWWRHIYTKAKIDPIVEQDFSKQIFKPRKHPGTARIKTITLPKYLSSAIKIILSNNSVKSVYQDGLKLDNYIRSRLPPPEDHELDMKAEKINNQLQRNYEQRLSQMSPEDIEKFEEKKQLKLFSILKKKVYHWANISYDNYTCLQYLLLRSPAEYAVLCKIFDEIDVRCPDYKPRSFFDFGSGTGTGLWAVKRYWDNHIFEYFSVDTSANMHELARLVLCNGRDNVELPIKAFFQRQFLPASSDIKYDIVLSAYTLFEMPDRISRLETLQKLWNKTNDFLIIVEYGSNAGFKLVNEARDFVLDIIDDKNTGHVFAPCPNDNVCPRFLKQESPCNFIVRYESLPYPSKIELRAELFSYVVLRKGPRREDDRRWPRIVRAPLVRSKHTVCRMCTKNGELKEIIFTKSKHDQITYRCARSIGWGDLLPIQIESGS